MLARELAYSAKLGAVGAAMHMDIRGPVFHLAANLSAILFRQVVCRAADPLLKIQVDKRFSGVVHRAS
ncbi:hypothetical protein N8D56_13150 [Devosia sp. A8/3-2]|nr:hypothetical protein N8D56_13150 [Devosia sp. A8/3-2]